MADCTDLEREYLDVLFSPGNTTKRIVELRTLILAERLSPEKRATIVRAWADSMHARAKWDASIKDVDFSDAGSRVGVGDLYDTLRGEAEALARSEGWKE